MFSLWRKARRENSAASRLLGSTSLRFALHGWQRLCFILAPLGYVFLDADKIGNLTIIISYRRNTGGLPVHAAVLAFVVENTLPHFACFQRAPHFTVFLTSVSSAS
nr:hypothetical protein [Thiolapillus sp.]